MADAAWHAPQPHELLWMQVPAEEANSMADTAYTRLHTGSMLGQEAPPGPRLLP